jgi:hypothetical protein
MKLQDGDLPVFRLRHGALQIIERPERPRVTRRREQKRMVEPWFICDAVAFLVRIFRSSAATGKPESKRLDNFEAAWLDGIARVGKGHRRGNAVLCALRVDGLYLFAKPGEIRL